MFTSKASTSKFELFINQQACILSSEHGMKNLVKSEDTCHLDLGGGNVNHQQHFFLALAYTVPSHYQVNTKWQTIDQ